MTTPDDTHDKKRLHKAIIKMSVADDWGRARQEWHLTAVQHIDGGHCLCGKYIVEHCFIANDSTGETTHVGNECIKNFTGVIEQADYTKEIFQALGKLAANPRKHPGGHLARLAQQNGWIRPSDIRLLMKGERMSLSGPQADWMFDINTRIVQGLTAEPFKYAPKPKRRKRHTNDLNHYDQTL